MRRLLMAMGACSLVLAGCGDTEGDGDADADLDPVAAAEQRVDRAEEALDEAQSTFDEASEQFCGDANDYVDAVDRYGRLFTDAEATVGDVTTAGQDLDEPQGDVEASANAATDARDDVAAAEQELADAQAELAEAESGTTAPDDDASTTTTLPLVPPASVDRVGEAQDDLDGAFEDVDADTPLTEAGEEVNAAAFALEIAWLRVLEEAGCLTDEQQAQAVEEIGAYTTALQTSLTTAGLYDGPIDGVYGPGTLDAVKQLQTDSGLPATGFVDQATAIALDEAVAATGAEAGAEAIAHTAAVQSVLTLAGYWTGPIDGEWTDALTAALEELQADLGVPVTGVVDPATLAALEDAIAGASPPETATTEVDEDATTTTTP